MSKSTCPDFASITAANPSCFKVSPTSVLLIAPSVHHRLLFRQRQREYLVRVGTRLAILAAVLTGTIRIVLMYQFNWELDSAGTYAAITTLWYAVLLSEFILVGLWMLSLVMGHVRGTDRLSPSHARAVLDQWAYITGLSIAVYLLVQYVN